MKLYRNLILTLIILLTAGSAFSQGIDQIAQKFEEKVSNQPAEKIFIHNDKPYYFTGETIWFKLYSVDASFHTLSPFSKIAYVELLSDDNQPLFQEKIRLDNGTGKGQIFINAKIGSGVYTLRAYTSLMKNAGQEYFFHKDITIISPFKANLEMISEATDWGVSFFPEGGELVYGLESRVSFEVTDNLGNPVNTTGFLVNEDGQRLQEITTSDRGIGSFIYNPQYGVSYSAIFNNGVKSFEIELPKPKPAGVVIKLDYKPAEKEYSLKIQSTENQKTYHVLIHSRGNIQSTGRGEDQ